MEKKLILFWLFWVAFPGMAWAQNEKPEPDSAAFSFPYRNAVYGELLGSGFFGSLNYERIFRLPVTEGFAGFRVGAFIAPEGTHDYAFHSETNLLVTIPIEIFFLAEKPWKLGRGTLRGEWGFGVTFLKEYVIITGVNGDQGVFVDAYTMPNCRFSCRWQPADKGFFMKAGVSVILTGDYEFPVIPLPGLAIGYGFGDKKN